MGERSSAQLENGEAVVMQGLFDLSIIWQEPLYFFPICSGVIVVFGMSEFMNGDIAQERRGEKEKDGIDHDRAAMRTTTPL